MIDRNSNKESKLGLKVAIVSMRSKLCLYTNLQIFVTSAFFILYLHKHLMYSLDLKTVDKVVCRRENLSVQPKFGHEELAKILPRPVRLNSLAELSPALLSNHILDFTLVFNRYFYN